MFYALFYALRCAALKQNPNKNFSLLLGQRSEQTRHL